MNAKRKLEAIKGFFTSCRQAGHTTSMIEGAKNTPETVVLAASHIQASRLKKLLPGNKVRSLNAPDCLVGLRAPVVLDNFTVLSLASESLDLIEELERDKTNLSNRLEKSERARRSLSDAADHLNRRLRDVSGERDLAIEMLAEYALGYSDADLKILANTDSGRGEIGPDMAKREIRRRAVIAKATETEEQQ